MGSRSIRSFVAVAVLALAGGVPGSAVAETSTCGVLVCATAAPTSVLDCGVEPGMGYYFAICTSTSEVRARGSSDLSIPGSLTWSGSIACTYTVTSTGDVYPCSDPEVTPPTTCTWAGLGEDACEGAAAGDLGPFYFFLLPGQCATDFVDYHITASVDAAVAKSLPLGLGTVDSATASEAATASVSDLPPEDVCAPPM